MTATTEHTPNTLTGPADRAPRSGLTPALRRGMPVPEGLPRSQSGTTPQRLIMRLLGDYWNALTEPLPSAALVELLRGFDISEPSARAALNRLTKRGLLAASKRGRNTYYGVDPSALPLLMDTFRKTVLFGAGEQRDWDGHWTLVAFSVPESQRQLRHAIRSRLRWVGCAALYDGLYCSPWDVQDLLVEMLEDLGVGSATVMRATVHPDSSTQPISAWDLDELRDKYLDFEAEFTPVVDAIHRGEITASDAIINRTKVMDRWWSLAIAEPELPAPLLPEDWPRRRARKLCFELHDTLAPIAQLRFQHILAKHSPELAGLVTHQLASDLLTQPV